MLANFPTKYNYFGHILTKFRGKNKKWSIGERLSKSFKNWLRIIQKRDHWGLSFSSEGGSQIYKKSASIKLQPPISATKIVWPPITRPPYSLNKLKLYWNQSFWTKYKIHSVVIWLPTFWSSKILWPPPFPFQKFMTPPVYLGLPLLKKMIAPPPPWYDWVRAKFLVSAPGLYRL